MGYNEQLRQRQNTSQNSVSESNKAHPRRILKKISASEDEIFAIAASDVQEKSDAGDSIIVPSYILGATIFAYSASFLISAITASASNEAVTNSLLIEHNYCQVAMGAVLFYEVVFCMCTESSAFVKVLLCPILTKFIGILSYSLLANGQLPLLQTGSGRVRNLTVCLLWATTSPIVIFVYSKKALQSGINRNHLRTSVLGSLLVVLSHSYSCISSPDYRSMLLLVISIVMWICFILSIVKIFRSVLISSPKHLLNVNILFLMSWAFVPTISLCGAMELFSFRSEEICHCIMDFSLKICLSALLLATKVTCHEHVEPPQSPMKRKASFSADICEFSKHTDQLENGSISNSLSAPAGNGENGLCLPDNTSTFASFSNASFAPAGSVKENSEGEDSGSDNTFAHTFRRGRSASDASGMTDTGGVWPESGGLMEDRDEGSVTSFSSRKNLTEFIGHKLPDEPLHYSQISGGKLEVLSVDDDPINQVPT